MPARASHVISGDQILVTLDVPKESVTYAGDTVGITMDDVDWRFAAKAVLCESNAAERTADPDLVLQRVVASVERTSRIALRRTADPHIARRRAVTNVLHQIADMVLSGTLEAVNASWQHDSKEIPVLRLSLATRHRSTDMEISLSINEALAEESA